MAGWSNSASSCSARGSSNVQPGQLIIKNSSLPKRSKNENNDFVSGKLAGNQSSIRFLLVSQACPAPKPINGQISITPSTATGGNQAGGHTVFGRGCRVKVFCFGILGFDPYYALFIKLLADGS